MKSEYKKYIIDGKCILPDNITEIEEYAFNGCTGLTSIKIPDSVTKIGEYALDGCTGLTSIEIPNSVWMIGDYALCGCAGLTHIDIPNSVKYIGNKAFWGCTGLTSIEIPDSVTEIGNFAFSHCTGLTSIEIPDRVTGIRGGAFSGCTGLTSIEIPDSVTMIGARVFERCTGLKRIEVSYNNQSYRSVNNCCLTKDGKTLVFGCNTSIIPDSVTVIGNSAFNGCTGLTSIEIPDSVTEIGGYAPEIVGYDEIGFCLGYDCKIYVFDGCTGLKSIILNITHNIPAESETFIKEALVEFRNSQVKLTVNIPIGTGYAYRHYPGFDQERLTFVPCNRHK